jgi:serine/threonine protein kinase
LHSLLMDKTDTRLDEWSVKWSLAKQAAVGLNYLHSSNMIHRDVKSPNFLVRTIMVALTITRLPSN